MNLKLATLAFFLLSFYSASAQEIIGVQAGVGISGIHSDYFENEGKQKARLNLGFSYDHFISANATFSANLLYQQRGFGDMFTIVSTGGAPVGTALIEFRFHYVALPIKVGFQFGNRGFGVGRLGLVPAILVKSVTEGPDPSAGMMEGKSDVTSHMQRFDLGGIAEAGGGFRLNDKCQLYSAVVYQHSISTFSGAAYTPIRHYAAYLNLGFRYVLRATKAREAKPAMH